MVGLFAFHNFPDLIAPTGAGMILGKEVLVRAQLNMPQRWDF
jgi:hypothetical protein